MLPLELSRKHTKLVVVAILRHCHQRIHRTRDPTQRNILPSKIRASGRRRRRRGFTAGTGTLQGCCSHSRLFLLLLEPTGEALEEPKRSLGFFIQRHLVLELASCLGEGTSALVDPHVAVYLVPLLHVWVCGNDAVDAILKRIFKVSFINDAIRSKRTDDVGEGKRKSQHSTKTYLDDF